MDSTLALAMAVAIVGFVLYQVQEVFDDSGGKHLRTILFWGGLVLIALSGFLIVIMLKELSEGKVQIMIIWILALLSVIGGAINIRSSRRHKQSD